MKYLAAGHKPRASTSRMVACSTKSMPINDRQRITVCDYIYARIGGGCLLDTTAYGTTEVRKHEHADADERHHAIKPKKVVKWNAIYARTD